MEGKGLNIYLLQVTNKVEIYIFKLSFTDLKPCVLERRRQKEKIEILRGGGEIFYRIHTGLREKKKIQGVWRNSRVQKILKDSPYIFIHATPSYNTHTHCNF